MMTLDRSPLRTPYDRLFQHLVPHDHELFRMARAVDWEALTDQLAPFYADIGRPAFPALRMVRVMVLAFWADLPDERRAVEIRCNLLYRQFLGVGLAEPTPSESTIADFRNRLGDEGARIVFDAFNQQWHAEGLIGTSRRVLDGVHIPAKVSRRSLPEILDTAVERLLDALAEHDLTRAEQLGKALVTARCGLDVPAPQRAEAEARLRAERALEASAGVPAADVRACAEDLRAMLRTEDRLVSVEDRDARWGHKRSDFVFLGFKAHESIDPDSRLITSVDVVAGNAHEGVRTDVVLAQGSVALDPGAAVIGDGLYNNATTREQVQERGLRPCFPDPKARRVADGFTYDVAVDRLTCRAGKQSINKSRLKSCEGDQYFFSVKDCRDCEHAASCLTRGEREGKAQPRRRVTLSDAQKARLREGTDEASWRRAQLRVRSRIEAKFDEVSNRHGQRRARYWGLRKVTAQVLWTAVVVNLKRAARLKAERATMPTRAAPSLREAA